MHTVRPRASEDRDAYRRACFLQAPLQHVRDPQSAEGIAALSAMLELEADGWVRDEMTAALNGEVA